MHHLPKVIAIKLTFYKIKLMKAHRNLKVLTNNVILNFEDSSKSKTFAKGSPRFRGTFYQWEMTSNCINK